jgi:hypothetical protein
VDGELRASQLRRAPRESAPLAAHRGLGQQPQVGCRRNADQRGPRPLCSLGLPVPLAYGVFEVDGELRASQTSRAPRRFAALAAQGKGRGARPCLLRLTRVARLAIV